MNSRIIILFAAIVCLSSCAGHKDRNIFIAKDNIFVRTEPLIDKTIEPIQCLQTDDLFGTTGIITIIDKYLVLGINSNVNRFRVLDLSDLNTVTDFLQKGNGPNEDVGLIFSQYRRVDNTNLLDVYAMNKHYIMTIDFDQLVQAGETVIVDQLVTPHNAMKAYKTSDYIISQTYFDEDYISIKINNVLDHMPIDTISLFGNEQYLTDYYPFFASCNSLQPNGDKMVMFMHNFDKINILDLKNNNHVSITTDKRLRPDSKLISEMISEPSVRQNTYYYYGATTNNNIYALRIGSKIDEPFKVAIQVFNWDYDYLAQFNIKEPITTFAIDEDNSLLYGLTRDEKLYIYQLE